MSDEFLQMFEPLDPAKPQTTGAPMKASELKPLLQSRLMGVTNWDDFLSEVQNWSVGYNEKSARAEISVATAGEDGTVTVQFLSDIDARMSINSIDRKIEQNNEDKAKVIKFKDWLQKKKNEELEVIFSERNPGFVKPKTEKEATGFLKFIEDWNNRPPKIKSLEEAIRVILGAISAGVLKLTATALTAPLQIEAARGWGYGGDSR